MNSTSGRFMTCGGFGTVEANDHGIQRMLHAGHDIERPVQRGAQIVEEGLLLDLKMTDVGLGRR